MKKEFIRKMSFYSSILVSLLVLGFFSGCASSPKLFEIEYLTVNVSGTPVQTQTMLIYADDWSGDEYSLTKVALNGSDNEFGYSFGVRDDSNISMRTARKNIENSKATLSALSSEMRKNFSLTTYTISTNDVDFTIDNVKYTLGDFKYVTTESYIVYYKHTVLRTDIRNAILNCSQLKIDGEDISINGISAIKNFLK